MYKEKKQVELEAGKLLVAEPFMLDPNFKHAVILLCEHHKKGALGFILNKSVRMKLNDLLTDFPEFEAEVHYGGPVQTNTIHFIHDMGHLLDDSYEVSNGLYMGGDFEQLKTLVLTGVIQPKNIRFFVGYTGWGKEQLAGELKSGSWILSESDRNYIFNSKKDEDLWGKVLEHKGDRYSVIAQVPDTVCLS